MTNSPNPDNQPESRPKPRLRLLLLSRTGIALGSILLVGLVGGALWIFLQNGLAPLIQSNLSQTLKRPVQLGRVERFSLNGLRFGPTSLPAIPSDPNHASVKAIDVKFDLLHLLSTRTLNLDVTLVQPDAYLEQDQQSRWVRTTLSTGQKPGPIAINPEKVQIQNANVVLVAYPKPGTPRVPFAIAQINGIVRLLDQNQLISLQLSGQPVTGGSFGIQGNSRLKTQQTNLQLQGQNLLGSNLTRLFKLPISIEAGRVDGNLKVQLLIPSKPQPLVFGTASLKAITAKLDRLPQSFINTQGALRFNGTQVALENVSTSFGKIPLLASGVLDTQGDFNLNAHVKAVSLANLQDSLNVKPPVPATGEFGADLAVRGPFLKPVLLGTFANINPIRIDRVAFRAISSHFTFSTATVSATVKDFQAIPAGGGKITGAGTAGLLPKSGVRLSIVAQNLPGDSVAHLYGVSPQIKVGPVSANAQASGSIGNIQTVVNWQVPQATYPASGTLTVVTAGKDTLLLRNTLVNLAGGNVRLNGHLAKGRWQASGSAAGIQLGRIAQVPPALQSPLGGRFNLSGTTASFKPGDLTLQGDVSVDIAGGTVTASNIQAGRGRWQVLGTLAAINLGKIAPASLALNAPVSGAFNLSGSTASFQAKDLVLQGNANLNVASGTVTASNIQAARGQWQLLGTASGIQVGQVLPPRASQLLGTLRDGRFSFSGSLATITPQTIQGNASGSLQVAGGTARATNVQLANGRWQGSFAADGVELGPLAQFALQSRFGKGGFAPTVGGRLNANVNASGLLTALNPANTQASGQLSLLNLSAGGLNLDPVLDGNVNLAPGQGANLQLAGEQDRISLALSPTYRPTSFLFQLGSAIATGRTQGDTLLVKSDNFPISIFKAVAPLPAAIASQPVSGTLDANLAANLNTYAVDGNLAIANPAVGPITANQLTAQFRYANGETLATGELTQGPGLYTLNAAVTQSPNGPAFQGQVKITQAQIQTILAALQSFTLQNSTSGSQPVIYGRAADVTTVPVGLPPNASLLTQLGRFSEVRSQLQQQRLAQQQPASPLSTALANITGTFGGEISFKGSLKNGLAAKFDLGGQNWQLNTYKVNQVLAQGSFENSVLTLLPVRIESGQNTLLAFNGRVGGTQQSGQLRLRNFPVEVLNNFVKLPVPVTGQLNATATVAGSAQNPRALGALQFTDGVINQKPLKSAQASFDYSNARLNFGSNIVVDGPDPIQITGSVPYALPFAAVKPDSDQISLDLNVQNQGFTVLNLLTDQVAWKGGQGKVQLQVRGTIKRPLATGIVTVNNATIAAQALPQPLTDVTGTARFNRDRIRLENLYGNFSRGNVQAKGVLPFFAKLKPNDPDQANPLSVSLNQLALNLKGLYQGGASGNVLITGAALSPVIGGEVQLAKGKVELTQQVAAAVKAALAGNEKTAAAVAAKPATPAPGGIVPAFDNLQITLGKGLAITLPPVLNFQADGGLTVNGTLNEPRPQGTIRLRGGEVNLFTTQFALDRRYKHKVTFTPDQPRNPNLDLRLIAVVPQVSGGTNQVANSAFNFGSDNNQSSKRVSDFGSLETVRVQAQITGPANKLLDDLQLTSNPSRSQSDIFALLGGGLAQTVGGGNAALGVANLAGSALLGNFQQPITRLGNAIGLSELRIFPTLLNSYSSSRTTSSLGLVGEGGVDITGKLSGSILRVLTDSSIPTQFGLSYQLTNTIRLQTLSDFSRDYRSTVEYQNQF